MQKNFHQDFPRKLPGKKYYSSTALWKIFQKNMFNLWYNPFSLFRENTFVYFKWIKTSVIREISRAEKLDRLQYHTVCTDWTQFDSLGNRKRRDILMCSFQGQNVWSCLFGRICQSRTTCELDSKIQSSVQILRGMVKGKRG